MSNQQPAPNVPPNRESEAPNDATLSRRTLLGGSAAVLATLAGCTGGNGEVIVGKHDESESTHDLTSGTVRVDAAYGDVIVRERDIDVVRVRTTKSGSLLASLSSVTVSSRQQDDTVIVESTHDGGGFLGSAPDVNVRIDVPSGVSVESMAVVNGDAVVENIDVRSTATIESQNGDAIARNIDADVTVATENGDAIAESVAGFVTARSTNGDVIIRQCDGFDGAETTNGDAFADVTALRGETTLQSENGDVVARLASDLDVHVVAETEHGDVTVSGSPLSVETATEAYVEGTVGAGTHDLRLQTMNDDITISGLE